MVRVCARDADRFFILEVLDALIGLQVELHVFERTVGLCEFIGVATEGISVAEGGWGAPI